MRLEGKVALISGGSRGLGAAMVRLFAREGASVVFGDILDREGQELEAEVKEAGSEALFVHLDVTKEAEWRQAIDTTVARYGKLNVLVNNAGVIRLMKEGGKTRSIRLQEISEELWEQVMAVNARGVFLGTKLAIPEMRKEGGGSIVNISSTAGLVGRTSSAAYAASKGAVRLFTKAVAIEHAKEGIRVNSVHPNGFQTPAVEGLLSDPQTREATIANIPLGRLGDPMELAYSALYLASDESSFVTGTELVVDGGFTAQ